MVEATRKTSTMHRSNLFRPAMVGITNLAVNPCLPMIAITKEHLTRRSFGSSLTIIEILSIDKDENPNYLFEIIEYGQVTGIAWTSARHLLVVTNEKNIKTFDVKAGTETFNLITDYGAIECLRCSYDHKFIVTGTSLGSVVVYKIAPGGKSVELVRHMTRTSNPVKVLDYSVKKKELPKKQNSPVKPKEPIKAGKRKRADSSDDEDDGDDEKIPEFLSSFDVTIYGAAQDNIIAWDFHKGTIIDKFRAVGHESAECSSIMTLNDGRIITGDTSGVISIYEDKCFSCQQIFKISESAIMCLAKNFQESSIIASGIDPTITVLKRDKESKSNYVLFEKSEAHQLLVTCAQFSRKKEFYTGGLDGLLIGFKIKRRKGVKEGRKMRQTIKTLPNFSNKISFLKDEMLFQGPKSLVIWRQPANQNGVIDNNRIESVARAVDINSRVFIHCSTFSDRWICFSTQRQIHIYERTLDTPVEIKLPTEDSRLSGCHIMLLCCDNQCLVVGVGKTIYFLDLNLAKLNQTTSTDLQANDADTFPSPIVAEYKCKVVVQQLLYVPNSNQLVVLGGTPRQYLYTFGLKSNHISDTSLKCKGYFLKPIITTAYNLTDLKDKKLYILTSRNQLTMIDISKKWTERTISDSTECEKIIDLPDDINLTGMLIVDRKSSILYGNDRLFKIDIKENRVCRQITDYSYLIKIGASVQSNNIDHLTMIEVPPEEYSRALPESAHHKHRFGV